MFFMLFKHPFLHYYFYLGLAENDSQNDPEMTPRSIWAAERGTSGPIAAASGPRSAGNLCLHVFWHDAGLAYIKMRVCTNKSV